MCPILCAAAGGKPNGKATFFPQRLVDGSMFETSRRIRGIILNRSKAASLSRRLIIYVSVSSVAVGLGKIENYARKHIHGPMVVVLYDG